MMNGFHIKLLSEKLSFLKYILILFQYTNNLVNQHLVNYLNNYI